jgi:type II secretory pathway pseudopilin PulG
MKFNLAIIFLLATLCVAVFATPVPEAAEVDKKRLRLRKLKRDTKALRKLNKRAPAGGAGGARGAGGAGGATPPPPPAAGGGAAVATPIDQFNKDTLSGPPDAQICNKSKLTKSNGTQNKTPGAGGRTCSATQLGEIPDITKMTSQLIVSPRNGQRIKAGQPFTVSIKVANLETGNFDDPNAQYYSFSQQLDKEGLVKGHSHVTIQALNGNNAPDAQKFDFFKGLNNAAVNGVLSVAVDQGLTTPGQKRICTMSSSFAHTPLIMPVAQRGAQDDCIRITIV